MRLLPRLFRSGSLFPRSLLLLALAALLPWPPARAQQTAAPALRLDVVNTKQELSGQMWSGGSWMAFGVDEDERSLNGDRDAEDTVLFLVDLRSMAVANTGIAINYALSDSDDDWPVALSDNLIVVQASEQDNGQDLNGDGKLQDDVLVLYTPASRQFSSLGFSGRQPTFLGGKLYFVQQESYVRKDLNGDGDTRDWVLGAWNPATRQAETLGMEAEAGFQAAGEWIMALTSEGNHFGRDLNGDGDTQDLVAQVYQISGTTWTSTGLEASFEAILTPKLVAAATDERKQGGKDLNGDGDVADMVCHVWDLSAAKAINTGVECSNGLAADGSVVAMVAQEQYQGKQDLNGDKDAQDDVAHVYQLGAAKPVNLGVDGSGGVAVSGGKVAVACSEQAQGKRDFNRDRDTVDLVLLVYDPARNKIANIGMAVEGDLVAAGGFLGWKVPEVDQFDRDLNRDGDTDDDVLHVMNMATGAWSSTGQWAGDYLCVTARGVGFATSELDQANRDLNMDGDTDDEIVQFARAR